MDVSQNYVKITQEEIDALAVKIMMLRLRHTIMHEKQKDDLNKIRQRIEKLKNHEIGNNLKN